MKTGTVYAAAPLGIGKDDFSREVSLGQTRPGLSLKYNQTQINFNVVLTDSVPHPYPAPWVQPALLPGASIRLYNFSTGFVLPYLVPKGSFIQVIEAFFAVDQDTETYITVDGVLYTMDPLPAGLAHIQSIYGYSTRPFDPSGLSSHLIDIIIKNVGGAKMSGGIHLITVEETI